MPERIANKLDSEERLVTPYGATRVRMDLDRIHLRPDGRDIIVEALWKGSASSREAGVVHMVALAISDGSVSKMARQSETFAYSDGFNRNTVGSDRAGLRMIHGRNAGL